MPSSLRVLITTAAFGEGHNSAARNLAAALRLQGVEVVIVDPLFTAAPVVAGFVQRAYLLVTTRFPQLWARIYRSTDRQDFSKQHLPLMRRPERLLADRIKEFRPHALVSTYPLFPYFFARLPTTNGIRLPVFTAITDSMEINSAWLKAPTDFFLVTDPATRDCVRNGKLHPGEVIDTGFPVSPTFAQLDPLPESAACDPFRVLYFPTPKRPMVRRESRALLEAAPEVTLTVVLGKNFRSLFPRMREIKAAFPGRVRIIGWTKRVPELLATHHIVIGKAGGATVHEALAARCPMLIQHLVPGQEEGNLRLLEQIGAGALAARPPLLRTALRELLANDAAAWRAMKRALATHGRNRGALIAAEFILNHLNGNTPETPESSPPSGS